MGRPRLGEEFAKFKWGRPRLGEEFAKFKCGRPRLGVEVAWIRLVNKIFISKVET